MKYLFAQNKCLLPFPIKAFTSTHLKTLCSSSLSHPRFVIAGLRCVDLCLHVATQSAGSVKKIVEDVIPIVIGHEREEIQIELEVDANHRIQPSSAIIYVSTRS
ncbi:unnamed protein product [Lathyrus oleraceus]|uniref:Uncharacterized protein n=1 Tax=Pisum sativum TaxID=3888 RepID=A0A9D4VGP7_PEA|nr:hypothetical protein KIW84_070813 [Pisum sativum]